MYVYVCVCMYVCMFVCTYVSICKYIYIHTCNYSYILYYMDTACMCFVYIYIVYIYAYTSVYTSKVMLYTCTYTIHGIHPKFIWHRVFTDTFNPCKCVILWAPGGFNWSKFLEFLPNCRLVAPPNSPQSAGEARFSDGFAPTDSRFNLWNWPEEVHYIFLTPILSNFSLYSHVANIEHI